MPWIRIRLNKFKLGFFKGVPSAIMMGWISLYWIKNQHFIKINKALKAAEEEFKHAKR